MKPTLIIFFFFLVSCNAHRYACKCLPHPINTAIGYGHLTSVYYDSVIKLHDSDYMRFQFDTSYLFKPDTVEIGFEPLKNVPSDGISMGLGMHPVRSIKSGLPNDSIKIGPQALRPIKQ